MFKSELEVFNKLSCEEKAEIIALMKDIISKRGSAPIKNDNMAKIDKH